MKPKCSYISTLLLIGLFFLGCGDDRAQPNSNKAVGGVSQINDNGTIDSDGDGLSDKYEEAHDLNASNSDTDGDGLDDFYESSRDYLDATNPDSDGDTLLDGAEINKYGTRPDKIDSDDDGLDDAYEITHDDLNATNPDTDEDGLKDGEEVYQYSTDPTNADSDNDILSDREELFKYFTDPNSSDSDEDCLLDGHEILYYETNASLKDTDGDNVEDGIEIYTYTSDELNTSCLSHPETKEKGYNPNPAIDGIPNIETDAINALDPTNDSDGDGQANIQESSCNEGDPKDKTKMCPYIIDSKEGKNPNRAWILLCAWRV